MEEVEPEAGKYLKPYQGLKHLLSKFLFFYLYCRKIPKTLSGIETFNGILDTSTSLPENT